MDSAKRLEKIFAQTEQLQTQLLRLHRQLDFLKQEAPTYTVPAKNLQNYLGQFENRLAVFAQRVLYGYGRPIPPVQLRKKYPNRPEILE